MLPAHTVALDVTGQRFTSWTSLQVSRSLEQAAASFRLDAFEGASARSPVIVRPQSSCRVTLSTDGRAPVKLITGYVDDVEVSSGIEGTAVSIVGRSSTCDLIDCMEPSGAHRWTNTTVLGIAQSLAAGYGVEVLADVDVGRPLPRFAAQPTERIFETIERAARLRSLLVTDDADGRLVLTRAGPTAMRGSLIDGQNTIRMRCSYAGSGRYSEIVCRGQRATDAETSASDAASVEASAADPTVSRRRVLTIRAEGRTDPAACLERARWEMLTRYGRSTRVSVDVPGWVNAAGELWTVNRLQHVRSDAALLDGVLLIVAVTFSRSTAGTTTTLELQPPEAFAQYQPPTVRAGQRKPVGYWLTGAQVKSAESRARATR